LATCLRSARSAGYALKSRSNLAYGWFCRLGIEDRIPDHSVFCRARHERFRDKSARTDGTFSRADFVFDQQRNIYICPGGAELTSTGNIDQGHIVYYRASKSDCSQRSLKPKCTTATVRKITRDLNEDVRDRVRALADTEAFQQSRRERKKVEMRFAHMKRILRLDRFRLRGLSGVRDEVLLAATAQNLRRLAKLLCRAPPPLGVACLT
jgi:hypothetical protein